MNIGVHTPTARELMARLRPFQSACVHHPFVVGIVKGTLPIGRLRIFALQDYMFLQEVYKIGALAILRSPEVWAEELNVGKLYDEVGHCELLLKFGGAIGLEIKDFSEAQQLPGTMAVTNYLQTVCLFGGPAEFGAALGSVSKAFLEICARVSDGLRRHYGLRDEDVQFFAIHSSGSEAKHNELDWKLASAFMGSEEDLGRAFLAAKLALHYEKMFFDSVMSAPQEDLE